MKLSFDKERLKKMWGELLENGVSEESLQIITSINGYNETTLRDVLKATTEDTLFNFEEEEQKEIEEQKKNIDALMELYSRISNIDYEINSEVDLSEEQKENLSERIEKLYYDLLDIEIEEISDSVRVRIPELNGLERFFEGITGLDKLQDDISDFREHMKKIIIKISE